MAHTHGVQWLLWTSRENARGWCLTRQGGLLTSAKVCRNQAVGFTSCSCGFSPQSLLSCTPHSCLVYLEEIKLGTVMVTLLLELIRWNKMPRLEVQTFVLLLCTLIWHNCKFNKDWAQKDLVRDWCLLEAWWLVWGFGGEISSDRVAGKRWDLCSWFSTKSTNAAFVNDAT